MVTHDSSMLLPISYHSNRINVIGGGSMPLSPESADVWCLLSDRSPDKRLLAEPTAGSQSP